MVPAVEKRVVKKDTMTSKAINDKKKARVSFVNLQRIGEFIDTGCITAELLIT